MTPTIEEVKRVARKFVIPLQEDNPEQWAAVTAEDLQAFAQHWIEVGRKMQRESDAKLFETDPSMENFSFLARVIRNNTGE